VTQQSWFRITHEGKLLGGGLIVTRMFGVTAAHCLASLMPSEGPNGGHIEVSVNLELGDEFPDATGRLIGVRNDLALLEIQHPNRDRLGYPIPAQASEGDAWRAPYRPSEQFPVLTGKVDAPNATYQLMDGASIPALQLLVDQQIGDHHGYSGGPVAAFSEFEREQILGILIEQFPNRVTRLASNVLFAAAISTVFESFEAFDYIPDPRESLSRESGGPSRHGQSMTDRGSPGQGASVSTQERLRDLDLFVRTVHSWKLDGVIDDVDMDVFKLLIRKAASSILD
jgi:hypothetical protein